MHNPPPAFGSTAEGRESEGGPSCAPTSGQGRSWEALQDSRGREDQKNENDLGLSLKVVDT